MGFQKQTPPGANVLQAFISKHDGFTDAKFYLHRPSVLHAFLQIL